MKKDRVLVVPCFNEAKRLNQKYFRDLKNVCDCDLLFVNDASTDNTLEILISLSNSVNGVLISNNEINLGKANSLRIGMQIADKLDYKFIGTTDADNSISISDIKKAFEICEEKESSDLVIGARVILAGNGNYRGPIRKWAGRMIATLVSIFIGIPVYDPQSPCKIFRNRNFSSVLDKSCKTRWFGEAEMFLNFEIVNRKKINIFEFSLNDWQDQEGSHLNLNSLFLIIYELFKLVLLSRKVSSQAF